MALPPPSPAGSPLVPTSDHELTKGLKWEAKPLVMVSHQIVETKKAAVTLVTADKAPIVVVWRYGKGKVAVILAQPLGEAPPGGTAFWDWPDWPAFMARLVNWLRPA